MRERYYGTFEGWTSAAALAATSDLDWTDPDVRVGGGESMREVFARVGETLVYITELRAAQTIVIVSHGDAIRVAAAWLAGLGPQQIPCLEVANGSITTVTLSDESSRE
ncbi:MAG TPA: histidine phosphatase family protein [Jatrophihabitantaceae bacterium]